MYIGVKDRVGETRLMGCVWRRGDIHVYKLSMLLFSGRSCFRLSFDEELRLFFGDLLCRIVQWSKGFWDEIHLHVEEGWNRVSADFDGARRSMLIRETSVLV